MYTEVCNYKIEDNDFNFLLIERLIEGDWTAVDDRFFFRDSMYRTRARLADSPYRTFRTSGTTHMEEIAAIFKRKNYKYVKSDIHRFRERIAITIFENELEILIAKQEMESGLYLPKPPLHLLKECEQPSSSHTSTSGTVTVDVTSKS